MWYVFLYCFTCTVTTYAAAQEGDPEGWWEESFKSHKDSKPYGPEGISFDLAFPQAQHVYGLPEHATSLALKPTIGKRTDISGIGC